MANTPQNPLPMNDRDGFIWMNGKMLPWRDANVHFLTHALHYSTAVFEGERAYDGHIFKSRAHSERLLNSAKIIHLPVEYSVDQIEEFKAETLKANKLSNAYIRVLAWRGPQMGLDPTPAKPHLGIAAWDWGKYFDPKAADTGISLGTSRWKKPAPDTAPVHSKAASLYNLGAMAKVEAMQDGFTDALMLDFEGYVAEATAANLFAMKDGEIHTPIADRFLNGLTRQTVIELARELGYKVIERRIRPEEVSGFDEIFLTGSAAEVTAVGKIDGHHYQVGPVTRKLRDAYSEFARQAPKSGKKVA